jgi:hypothetical protein
MHVAFNGHFECQHDQEDTKILNKLHDPFKVICQGV